MWLFIVSTDFQVSLLDKYQSQNENDNGRFDLSLTSENVCVLLFHWLIINIEDFFNHLNRVLKYIRAQY